MLAVMGPSGCGKSTLLKANPKSHYKKLMDIGYETNSKKEKQEPD